MISITFTAASLPGADTRFEHAYEQAVQQMKALLDGKAKEERDTHEYNNRTGDLEASTYAGDIIATATGHEVEFGARMFYAEFVNARGLMRVDELAEEARLELEYLFDGLGVSI
jgi:hypothetical protein